MCVGPKDGEFVGEDDGDDEGLLDGACVGSNVTTDGDEVGEIVGPIDGSSVGQDVYCGCCGEGMPDSLHVSGMSSWVTLQVSGSDI